MFRFLVVDYLKSLWSQFRNQKHLLIKKKITTKIDTVKKCPIKNLNRPYYAKKKKKELKILKCKREIGKDLP